MRIPVLHVEAGLRSFNRHQPEKQNRVLIDHLAEICSAPTEMAVAHLQREGFAEERIVRTGDVMADAAHIFDTQAEANAAVLLNALEPGIAAQTFILTTTRCTENTNNQFRLQAILTAMANAALPVLLPLPPTPRTRRQLTEHGLEGLLQGLSMTEPLGSWRWFCWSDWRPWWLPTRVVCRRRPHCRAERT